MADAHADLVQSVNFEIEPIRLAPLYRAGLLVAAITVLLLPVIYVALVILVAYGVWYHATNNLFLLETEGSIQFRALTYLTPIVAGVLGTLFMVKPIFAPAPRRPEPRAVTRASQPILYAYVERLCRTLGAPPPKRIDVDMQVNASASFRRGFGSFLGEDLVLTVGLPLTAGMTLGQWTGVLAHEFGHFTQGAAMRFTYLIGTVNHWFARVVYERDAWDEQLERWVQQAGHWAQIVLLIAKGFIWVSRKILWGLMMAGLAVSSFLSRQMEFNADLHQARVSGSDLFRATHLRLSVLSAAWFQATEYLGFMWNERRLADNVVDLVLAEARRLTASDEVMQKIEADVVARETGTFDTHPSTADRIRAVEAAALPPLMDDNAPASVLFSEFEGLCRSASLTFYEEALGTPVDPRSLVAADLALAEREALSDRGRAVREFFFGTDLPSIGIAPHEGSPPPDDDPSEVERSASRLGDLRERMRSGAKEVSELFARLDEVGERRTVARLVERSDSAGIDVNPEAMGISTEDLDDPESAVTEATASFEDILAALQPHSAVAAERIGVTLALARRPELEGRVEREAATLARLDNLLAVIRALVPQWPTVRVLRQELFELGFLLSQAGPRIEPGPMQLEVVRGWRALKEAAEVLREAMQAVPYPYDHAHGSVPVGDFLLEGAPEMGPEIGNVASAAVSRLFQLYSRLWGDLAALALEVEEIVGLAALEEDLAE